TKAARARRGRATCFAHATCGRSSTGPCAVSGPLAMFHGVDAVLTKALELDARLVEAAKNVKVLSSLAWPESEATKFLGSWKKGKPKLPDPSMPKVKLGDVVKEFDGIAKDCDAGDPLHTFLQRTARSYSIAARMLARSGTKEFVELSTELYGRPTDPIGRDG